MRIIPNEQLSSSDLIIDAVCEGGAGGNAADDPISKILQGVGNQGGFRAAGTAVRTLLDTEFSLAPTVQWARLV